MRKVQILGTGCPKCKQLAEHAEAAAHELGLDCEIVKVTDINDIMKLEVMMTPGLAVDGVVKVSGRIPTVDEIKALLLEGSAPKGTEPPDPAGSEMRMERP